VDADITTYDDKVATLNTSFNQTAANPSDKKWIVSKLQHMVDVDQYTRKYNNTPYDHAYSNAEKSEFINQFGVRWRSVDTNNTSDLKELIKIYTWFMISEFGQRADQNAWLLVQHADMDYAFQKSVLTILSGLWQKGETNPTNYAYLFDRVAASFNDPTQTTLQRYGTQGECTGPGTWEPLPMEDPERIDDRRATVGLGTEADYIKLFKDICHFADKFIEKKASEIQFPQRTFRPIFLEDQVPRENRSSGVHGKSPLQRPFRNPCNA